TIFGAQFFVGRLGLRVSDAGAILGAVSYARWIATVVLSLLVTYVCAAHYMGWFTFIMSPAGRASRRDYWLRPRLHLTAASLTATLTVGAAGYAILLSLAGDVSEGPAIVYTQLVPFYVELELMLFWPAFCAAAKRLHDRGKSAWFLLISLIPLIGPI